MVATCVRTCAPLLLSAPKALLRSYLHMPCGLLRGALHSFGILARCDSPLTSLTLCPASPTLAYCSVSAETPGGQSCVFTIKVRPT